MIGLPTLAAMCVVPTVPIMPPSSVRRRHAPGVRVSG